MGRIHLHRRRPGGEGARRFFDPASALQGLPPQAQVYCCGPTALMEAVRASVHAPADRSLLSEAQRRSGRSIMVCVSRARSSVLELDL
ncbi:MULTISPECIES: hypothetical protein [Methylibium]|uniref:Uncharacterized protein n=1 Tax=Methylibium petroleiphilum (strain ATCC BAA-1232 / LMG 22953 / PM1) TaxID=420662 RepID=A2SE51_METPP|nr:MULTISPECIES: hypothetical protein [Methylibium]ABM93840.1 hypothetical protein Mpe_A0878 [Methylibium petroleiphilum PM1]